jgi:hypothetical protein
LRSFWLALAAFGTTFVALAPSGCGTSKEPEKTTYFERTISPILTNSCTRTSTGASCHLADPKGNALGNLDTSSYAAVKLRPDLLVNYGPYGQPAFLLKNVPPPQIEVQAYDGEKVTITTDIRHAGGSIFDPTESAYQILRRWIENGATENNAGRPPANLERLPCTGTVPIDPAFDPSRDPGTKDFPMFRDRVNPLLKGSCAAANCHGTAANELYLTCGDSPEQLRWNYFSASEYLAQTAEQSEIVRRTLAPEAGGSFHEGGTIFDSPANDGYRTLVDWATEHGPPQLGQETPAYAFFAHRVQPVLVKKGCMMLQCHAAPLFHEYRLRGGSGGSFSLSATKRNYKLSLAMSSLESDDPNASRLVRKNLYRPEVFDGAHGVAHRGGPLFEDFPKAATADQCATGNYDYDKGDLDKIPPYCVVAEWLRRERDQVKLAPLSALVYVKRPIPAGPDRVQDFDVYAPGAQLRIARLLTQNGQLKVDEDQAVKTCGFDASADIKRPMVSWDGKKIAFAARTSAAEPLQVYEVNADGTGCVKHPEINAGPTTMNGLLVHNFDPAYSPPDAKGIQHIVFASTRGNAKRDTLWDYSGPQRTPADPTKPNANLYVYEPDPAKDGAFRVKQLTYLHNMERQPAFMSDGRVIMTAEKRAPGFYQLALRRINVDGGDYHPLFAQRGSIGFLEATSVVETVDKNFVAIFADRGSVHGAGKLGTFNRSIGIDFTSTRPEDYPVDPSVLDPQSLTSPEPGFFLRSLKIIQPTVAGAPQNGVFATPSPLPNGRVLVSYGAGDAKTFGGDWDIYLVEPLTGDMVKLLGEPGSAEVEPVAVYARQNHGLFASSLDEPNGHTQVKEGRDEAELLVVDFPMLVTMLFQNTPTGRVVEPLQTIEVWEDLPPPLTMTSFAGGGDVANDEYGQVYVKRRLVGNVPLLKDGSVRVAIPGGIPIVLHLPDTDISRERKLPRWQKEQFVFAPGEYAHQSFKREFFDGFCGQCHGAISGRGVDVSVQPDMLTQASSVLARDTLAVPAYKPPADRTPVQGGAPATP